MRIGVIEKDSGDLIRFGFADLSATYNQTTESLVGDVPDPPKVKGLFDSEYHRYTSGVGWSIGPDNEEPEQQEYSIYIDGEVSTVGVKLVTTLDVKNISSGTYVLSWSYSWSRSKKSGYFLGKILEGNDIHYYHKERPNRLYSNESYPASGEKEILLTKGTKKFKFFMESDRHNRVSYINNLVMKLRRKN